MLTINHIFDFPSQVDGIWVMVRDFIIWYTYNTSTTQPVYPNKINMDQQQKPKNQILWQNIHENSLRIIGQSLLTFPFIFAHKQSDSSLSKHSGLWTSIKRSFYKSSEFKPFFLAVKACESRGHPSYLDCVHWLVIKHCQYGAMDTLSIGSGPQGGNFTLAAAAYSTVGELENFRRGRWGWVI